MGKRKRSGSFSKYDDGSKKSDDGDSQEEVEGESIVLHKGNIINGVRYSARVQEKQEKLRREASPSKQTVADSTVTATIAIPSQSVPKTTSGDDVPESFHLEASFISQSLGVSGEKKKKRTWELWSQEDKQLFFEALNEFGKDFDAIQNYLASKLKPKSKLSCNQTVAKNKDQVRHFYYRTWNKISKYLTFPKDMKKAYQEMYGLINYGELRKKQRVLNLKTAVKLSELVEKGTTTIKVRGKTFRIKTPVCRALKKLNQLDDIDQIRVPCKLCVELVPRDGDTWASIQRVSHNPRVKIFVPLQRTLASLIVYLEERWKTDQNRLKEEFSLTMFGRPRTRLRLIPVENRDLSVPIFKFSEITSATKISLNSYVQNCMHQERQQDLSMVAKKFKTKTKCESDLLLSHRDPDYFAAEADVSDADGCEATPENQFKITLRREKPHCGVSQFAPKPIDVSEDQENSNGFPDNAFWSVHEENANAAVETDAGETDYGFDDNIPSPIECDENDNTCDEDCVEQGASDNLPFDPDAKDDKPSTCTICKTVDAEDVSGSEKVEKHCTCVGKKSDDEGVAIKYDFLDSDAVAKGWNAEEAGTITLGQIYLLLGKADKLCFEYTWDKSQDDNLREDRARNLVDKLVNIARLQKKKKSNRGKTGSGQNPVASCASITCAKCSVKVSPPPSGELYPLPAASKDLGERSKVVESPPRPAVPLLQPGEVPEEHKGSGKPSPIRACKESPKQIELIKPEPPPVESTTAVNNVIQEVSVTASSTVDDPQPLAEEVTSQSTATPIDPCTSKVPDSTPSGPGVSKTQLPTSTQTGLIELSSLANTQGNELDSSLKRAAANIKATILPAPPAIITAVSLADTQKTMIGPGHSSTITSVCPATVLVTEPAMFAGLTADTSTFVTIQQCATSTHSPSHSVSQNTQDTKFRRPADIPILMKPPSDDRSTNDDSSKVTVPKPFLDLPKGNRRIGRRPAWKQRVIIPRMLPLLPKPDTTMTTLIAIPPVGISVVPVSTDSLAPITTLPVAAPAKMDIPTVSTSMVTPSLSLKSEIVVAVSSILSPATSSSRSAIASSIMHGSSVSTSGTTKIDVSDVVTSTTDKASSQTVSPDSNQQGSCRQAGFEESLDNLSLSSFMDISIPESTRFIASDLRLEELECSNSSITLSGMLDESSRKNSRDPPLLETPKKGSGSDDSPLQIPSPQRIAPLETSWPAMNEVSDLFMGGLFSGNEALRNAASGSLSEGDLNFQSVIGENSLDFDSKLGNFSSNLADSNKE